MKKPSEVFKSIRFAKLDPTHEKGHKGGSQDDEEHGAVSEVEWNQQLAHQKKRAMQEEEQLDEKNAPTNPSLWSRAKALARSKFDVYPSAYANGWAAKWYKSKGGGWKTVSEETLDEGKMKDIATGREEDERLSKVPFDKPYSTVKKVVTDKSGAKHGPMSRARDLARKGSRAASIVREAADKAKAKKKEKKVSDDTFQAEPELSSQIIRND